MMTPDDWRRVNALFHEALSKPDDEQLAYIAEQAGDDAALVREVEALLRADKAPAGIFAVSADELVAAYDPEPDLVADGLRIGPYGIVRKLGQGGMGTVYLAYRDDVGKYVALKLVRGGLASAEAMRRFGLERRVLARLEHEHIARLLDAGCTDDGTPYFAMEFVHGEPLLTYCEARLLTLNERLQLFVQIGEAVAFAHQNLVVHRDLKPSNILIAEDEKGQPRVKLLDFGIAKLLEEDGASEVLTRTGWHLMTPEYAAPEQVRGEAITTATDVYALGVLLYELVAGQRPYDLAGKMPHEAGRIILDTSPRKPSTVLRRRARADDGAAADRRLAASRRVRGDLDVICLKALQKEAGRRYASAEAFVEDVKRYLEGMPVHARPLTAAYRVTTFVRRHAWSTAIAASFVVLLMAFALRETRLRAGAEAARDEAEQVSAFLIDLFDGANPHSTRADRADTLTVVELIDLGAERVQTHLGDQPLMQATMYTKIAQVYHNLSRYDEAEALLTEAFRLRRAHFGPDDLRTAESQHLLGRVYREVDRFEEAKAHLEEALGVRRKHLGQHPDVALSLNYLGQVLVDLGRYEEAVATFEEALAIRRTTLGPEAPETATTINHVGRAHTMLGRFDDAIASHRQALEIRQRVLGPKHPHIATSLNNLAGILRDVGRYEEAEVYYLEALRMHRELLGAEHRSVAADLSSLSSTLHALGRLEEAEAMQREALAMRKRVLGPRHDWVGNSHNGLGLILHAQGRYEEAEWHHRQSLELSLDRGADHPWVGISKSNLAVTLLAQGRVDEAEQLARDAVDSMEARGYERMGRLWSNWAACLLAQGRLEEAETWLLESQASLMAQRGPRHIYTRENVDRLYQLYLARGDQAEAQRWHQFGRDGVALPTV